MQNNLFHFSIYLDLYFSNNSVKALFIFYESVINYFMKNYMEIENFFSLEVIFVLMASYEYF